MLHTRVLRGYHKFQWNSSLCDGKAYVNFQINEMACHACADVSEIKIKLGNYDCVEPRRVVL